MFFTAFIIAYVRCWRLALEMTSILPCFAITGALMNSFIPKYLQCVCEYGVGERGQGSIKGDDRALCWVCSMLPLNILVLILCRILVDNVLELSKMLKRATWKKVLESEEDKKKIAETFKRIDEHTKNFHVRSPTYFNQSRS